MFIKSKLVSIFLAFFVIAAVGCGGGGGGGGGGADDNSLVTEPFFEENSFEYFPINSNATWVYSSYPSNEQSWWQEDAGVISGYKSYALTRALGSKEYYVSDETGVYLIGLYIPKVIVDGKSYTADIKFDEQIPVLTQEMIDTFRQNEWSHYAGGGEVDISPDYGVNNIRYSVAHQYFSEGQCTIEDCMKNFRTEGVKLSIDVSTTIDGYDITMPVSFYAEFAKGVGIVEFMQDNTALYLSSLSGIDIPDEHNTLAEILDFQEKIYGKQLESHCVSVNGSEQFQRVYSVFADGVINNEGYIYSDAACTEKVSDMEPWQISYEMTNTPAIGGININVENSNGDIVYNKIRFTEECIYMEGSEVTENGQTGVYPVFEDYAKYQCLPFDISELFIHFPIRDDRVWVYNNESIGNAKFWFERISKEEFLFTSDIGVEKVVSYYSTLNSQRTDSVAVFEIDRLKIPALLNDGESLSVNLWPGTWFASESSCIDLNTNPWSGSGKARIDYESLDITREVEYDLFKSIKGIEALDFKYGNYESCLRTMNYDFGAVTVGAGENIHDPVSLNMEYWLVENIGMVKLQINDQVFDLIDIIDTAED